MTRRTGESSCARETEVVDRVLAGSGAAALSDDLRRHVDGCQACGELLKVIEMLQQDHADAVLDVTVPAAGQVWWRAAVRARLEAAHAAARPMAWAQGMTGATLVGITCAALILAWPALGRVTALGFTRSTELWDATTVQLFPSMLAALERSLPLALAVIAAVVVMPLLVLYFALAGDD
jgi:hypothetical protein